MFTTGLVMASISVREGSPSSALVGLAGMAVAVWLIDQILLPLFDGQPSVRLSPRAGTVAVPVMAALGCLELALGLVTGHALSVMLGACLLSVAAISAKHRPSPAGPCEPTVMQGAAASCPEPRTDRQQG